MQGLKTLLTLGALAGSYQYWHLQQHEAAAGPMVSGRGFVRIPAVADARPDTVLVMAAKNCPKADAQRANALAQNLVDKGISVERRDSISFVIEGTDSPEAKNLSSIMNGPLPAVIVAGRASSNPTLDEVVAEVHRNSP